MKIQTALMCLSFAFAAVFVARAEVGESVLANPDDPSDVWGRRISGLGANGRDVALVFTKTGATMEMPLSSSVNSIWYLVVAGGGSGGTSYANGNAGGGGGGAGGMLEAQNVVLTSHSISVSVGAGGTAVKSTSNNNGARPSGNNGGNSVLTYNSTVSVTAHGGGGGAGGDKVGKQGGSGGGAHTTFAAGAPYAGEGNSGGTSASNYGGGGGGGKGAAGSNATSTTGAAGGNGAISLIGEGHISFVHDGSGNDYFSAGGGGGPAKSAKGGAGGIGGGGAGGDYVGANSTSPSGTNYGCGGGGTPGNGWFQRTSGAGFQGVVVVRYTMADGEVFLPPSIESVTYDGAYHSSDAVGTDDYDVVNNGGTDAGSYDVIFTLRSGRIWEGGSSAPITNRFVISPAVNRWSVNPTISKSYWVENETPGVITAGVATFGTVAATITKDGGMPTVFDGTIPTVPGQYVVTYTPEVTANYAAPDPASKSVEFEVLSNSVVPPFAVSINGTIAPGIVDGVVTAAVPFAVSCEFLSVKTVDTISVLYRLDGESDTDSTVIASNVALDAVGCGTLNDLKPGATYLMAVCGVGGDTCSPTSDWVRVTMPGPVSSASSTATFDAQYFTVSGTVNDGIGACTVTLYWSINNADEYDTCEVLTLEGNAFTKSIQYYDVDDVLTWKVVVENDFTSSTYGDLHWTYQTAKSTRNRNESAAVTYTWTGAGGDGLWANRANWSPSRTDAYGYPDSTTYASVRFTNSVSVALGGGTFGIVGTGISASENLGTVTLRNGTIETASKAYASTVNGTDFLLDAVNFVSKGEIDLNTRWNILIPANGFAAAPAVAATLKDSSVSGTFILDVTDFKGGRRVPIVSFTGADQTVRMNKKTLTLKAMASGSDVTAARKAKLEWSSGDNTIYYKQNSELGPFVYVR